MGDNKVTFSEALSVGKEELIKLVKSIIAELRPSMSLEDLQRVYTKSIDTAILKEEASTNCKYIGGEFNIENVNNDQYYSCGYRLYFQDAQKKIFELAAQSKDLPVYNLSDSLRKQLSAEKIIKFEIPEPSEKAREKFERENPKVQ